MSAADAPKTAIIGLVMLLMSATLAWLSSPATLEIRRDSGSRVVATIESRLFGLITNSAERIEGIRSVSMVSSRVPGGDSDTPDRLVFQIATGPVDLGRNQQLFTPDFPQIDEFLKADAPPPGLTLSSIARGEELRRFLFAQAIAVLLFFGGLGVVWTAIRRLLA
jgi:hypothetical protein